jgi:flagellar biogenesis protein FliO
MQTEQTTQAVNPGGLAGWLIGFIRDRETHKTAKHMSVVEHLSLGGRRQLTLIVCDGERFLVGGGIEGVETIVRVGPESPCV